MFRDRTVHRKVTAVGKLAIQGVLIAATVVAFVGISAASTATRSGRIRAVVVFLGDSNVALSASQTAEALLNRDNGYAVVEIARPGATIRTPDCAGAGTQCTNYDFWKTRVTDLRSRVRPEAYVVDLGINDTAQVGTPTSPGYSRYDLKIDWLMQQLGGVPVFWSLLPCDIEPPTRAEGCKAVNASLTSARKRHKNLALLDWAGAARGHHEFLGTTSTAHGIHFTVAGATAWSRLVSQNLDQRFPTS